MVRQEVQDCVDEITRAIEAILRLSSDQRSRVILERVKELNDLSKSADDFLALWRSSGWPSDIVDRLKRFTEDLHIWRSMILNLVTQDASANARARFADAGAWAIHFSMVRMTITTFFIAAAWGVVSVKWNEFSPTLCFAAFGVWALAGFFLIFFTKGTLQKSKVQKECLFELPTGNHQPKSATLKPEIEEQIRLPIKAYWGATAGFVVLLILWAMHGRQTPVAWTAIATKSSIANQEHKATVESVDFSAWEDKVKRLADSLDEIKRKLEHPSTPTPTPLPPPSIPPITLNITPCCPCPSPTITSCPRCRGKKGRR
jgi:hypothetical protein